MNLEKSSEAENTSEGGAREGDGLASTSGDRGLRGGIGGSSGSRGADSAGGVRDGSSGVVAGGAVVMCK